MIPPSRFSGPPQGRRLAVEVVSDVACLESRQIEWQSLAEQALEPNVFYEPWMMLPALEAYGNPSVSLLLVHETAGGAGGGRRLVGCFPVERRSSYRGIPVATLGNWRYVHCYLGTPLVHRDRGRACLAAVLRWLARAGHGAALMELAHVHGDGPFGRCLAEALDDVSLHCLVSAAFDRALLRRPVNAERYLRRRLSGRSRKNLRRLQRRLGEQGELQYRELRAGDDVERWIKEFLALEASGWKGREETALACNGRDRRFFMALARAAHRRGRLRSLSLRLNHRPLAMTCDLLSGSGCFAFKVAYAEDYRRYSPGVLTELENIRRLSHDPGIQWVDSCADPRNDVVNRLWSGRRSVQTLAIPTKRPQARMLVAMLSFLRPLAGGDPAAVWNPAPEGWRGFTGPS